MTIDPSAEPCEAILLDIEGTTTPIAFVYDVLFPFARAHVRAFVERHGSRDEIVDIVRALASERETDRSAGTRVPEWREGSAEESRTSVSDYVLWLMDRDRKSTGLKALQGEVWRQGYESGELVSDLFPDVVPALRRWVARGCRIAIFSSGSIAAQRLLFGHTSSGDVTECLSGYFDTTVGPKGEAASYRRIAAALGCASHRVLFVSDVTRELDAARSAGYQTRLAVRPGNAAQEPHDHLVVHAFDEIDAALASSGEPASQRST